MDSAISYDLGHNGKTAPTRPPLGHQFAVVLRAAALIGVIAAVTPALALSQNLQVGDVLEQYMRVLQVDGLVKGPSFFLRPLVNGALADSVGPWAGNLGVAPTHVLGAARWTLDPARLRYSNNSAIPFGQNDDAMWQGRGTNFALDGGATLQWGALTVTAHPTLVYAQNQPFALAPVKVVGASQYEYPWWPIDLPQRFGPNAYVRLDPGQSSVALAVRGAKLSFGTENLWWGPGIQTSILMTNDAPGFPHASLGTSRPWDIGIGTVEGQWIWGGLQQSAWYTGPDAGQGRFFTGAEVAFSPAWSFLKGLTVGGSRVFNRNVPPGGLSASDYLAVFQLPFKQSLATAANPTGEDQRDQILSFNWRWVLPASGFEMYGEWARNDHSWNLTDFILEPEHSQAYSLGFQKVASVAPGQILAVNGELTHLERDPTLQIRDDPIYYTNAKVPRGYTQLGQMIGSALGPGGDGQYVGADLYADWGRLGVFGQRQVHDNDAFYQLRAAAAGDTLIAHDVSFSVGGRAMVFMQGIEAQFNVTLTKELNRYMQLRNAVWNEYLGVTLGWRSR